MSDNILRSTSPSPPDSTSADPDPTVDEAVLARSDATTAVHRARLYSLLAIGFERPGPELAELLGEGVLADDLVAAARGLGDEDVVAAAEAVADALADRGDLASQWASLFGVEEGITVPPYELRYLPGPLLTNVRDLADITGFYEAFGLSIADGKNDRGDHVCFQTEFLGHLSLREATLRDAGDDEGVAVVTDAQRSFVGDHLGRWFWRFADEVSKHDDSGVYAALADLLAAVVEADIDRLDVDPDWVPDDPQVIEWDEDIFGDAGRGCGGCGLSDDNDIEGVPDVPGAGGDPGVRDQPGRDDAA